MQSSEIAKIYKLNHDVNTISQSNPITDKDKGKNFKTLTNLESNFNNIQRRSNRSRYSAGD